MYLFRLLCTALLIHSLSALLGQGVSIDPGAPKSNAKFTITGHLTNAANGEVLISAKVFEANSGKGVLTNNYGFFSLTLAGGPVSIIAAESGYKSETISFNLQSDTIIDFKLAYYQVDEVEIVAEEVRQIQNQTEMSTTVIPVEQIKSMPALMGEVDVIKAVQMLPGVQSGTEGTTGLYVRGGGPDQNLILLDDVPLYYVSHLGGFFSVFNADAISSVKLTKGGFPARYGGRLSSVLDIRMKDGNKEKIEGEGSLGLIAGKLSINGPIGKKTTFLASARRTWIDLLMRPISSAALNSEGGSGSAGYQFYDLNGKITHTFSDKDRLYLSAYGGDDAFSGNFGETFGSEAEGDLYEEKFKSAMRWGNRLAALRWNHIWNPKLFSNLTATYTNYRFSTDFGFETRESVNADSITATDANLRYQSGVRDFGLKLDFEYYPSPSHSFRFGAGITRHRFVPGLLGYKLNEGQQSQLDTTFAEQRALSWEGGIYAEDEIRIGSRFSANVGAHLAFYQENDKQYLSPQLRLAARYQLNSQLSVKGSFVQMTQFLHLLTNSGVGLPIDLWVPATDEVPPQNSLQGAVGIAASLWDDRFEFSVEGYYKRMDGLIEYKEGQSFFVSSGSTQDWQDQVETGGIGTAYGMEVLLQKKRGRTTGWIGYTLSWNNRQFDNLNEGQEYPYRYDRRHDISMVLSHKLSDRISLGANWIFGTGNAITLPNGGYGVARQAAPSWINEASWQNFSRLVSGVEEGGVALYEDGRNGFRMQPYHRMDVSISFHKKKNGGSAPGR